MYGIWVLTLPARPRAYSLALLLLPLAVTLFMQDWLVRQSLTLWQQGLQAFAPLLALWVCVEAVYLAAGCRRFWHVLLPGPWLILLYWQLQFLQSGLLSWPFLMQMLAVAGVMALGMALGQRLMQQHTLVQRTKLTLALMQWLLAWGGACRWPQESAHLQAEPVEALISLLLLTAFVILGVVLYMLWPGLFSKELSRESVS